MSVGNLVTKWDTVLNNNTGSTGMGVSLLMAIINSVMNFVPADIQTLLADIGVDAVSRSMFMVMYQPDAEQLATDLANFTTQHAITAYNVVAGTLILETL